MDSIIKAENLTYSYRTVDGESQKIVLSGFDLEIERGTFVAILGHNGSGKSTLAKHFNGIYLPAGGKVYVDGIDTCNEEKLLDVRKTVGMVFQNPDNQLVANVVEEDVAFAPENLGCPPDEIRIRVNDALRIVGMYEFRDHAPNMLSGGQKQRIAIAGVLAMSPKVVVFDEPTAMLDPQGRADVVRTIRKLRDDMNVTVVLITHHMNETVHADRVVVMSDGKIVMDGTPGNVFMQVDRMRENGLDVPETVDILYELNKSGFDLRLDALSVEDCANEIMKAF